MKKVLVQNVQGIVWKIFKNLEKYFLLIAKSRTNNGKLIASMSALKVRRGAGDEDFPLPFPISFYRSFTHLHDAGH
jgi:hypothetical protein